MESRFNREKHRRELWQNFLEVKSMTAIGKNLAAVIAKHKTELPERFDVKSLSIFGSVSKGKAGLDSDVDVLVHFRKTRAFLDLSS